MKSSVERKFIAGKVRKFTYKSPCPNKKLCLAYKLKGLFTKLARGRFETHCKDVAVEMAFIAAIARSKEAPEKIIKRIQAANTAREVFLMLKKENKSEILQAICLLVKKNSVKFINKKQKVRVFLVGYNGKIEAEA